METEKFFIRKASSLDERILREMLYHSLHVPQGGAPFDREIVYRPELAKYVDGWGQAGDVGVIAMDSSTNQPIGAAWLRLFKGIQKGYGYIDDETPELGMAVLPEYRGAGVGTALLKRLLAAASMLYDAVSLSVSEDNTARHLYERTGFEYMSTCGTSMTMAKKLRP